MNMPAATVARIAQEIAAFEWTWTADDVAGIAQRLGAARSADRWITKDGARIAFDVRGTALAAIEIELDRFDDSASLDSLEYENKIDEFFDAWDAGTGAVSRAIGTPAFTNGFGNRGFPSDQTAMWLSLWNTARARLMLEQQHQGRGSAFRIVIVATPPVTEAARRKRPRRRKKEPDGAITLLAKKLMTVDWSWAQSDAGRLMADLGAELDEDVGERQTWRLEEGLSADLYLFERSIVAVEVILDVFEDPEELEPDEYEARIAEFTEKLERVAASVRAAAGDPLFAGEYDSEGFPGDQDALRLVLWRLENARLMVELKHEDREVPIRLLITVAPPDDE